MYASLTVLEPLLGFLTMHVDGELVGIDVCSLILLRTPALLLGKCMAMGDAETAADGYISGGFPPCSAGVLVLKPATVYHHGSLGLLEENHPLHTKMCQACMGV